jgi:DNA-binding response OmpR family regulator
MANILLVDDEPKVAFFLRKALERSALSHRVSVAHSGQAALDRLREAPIDLLITDLRMPDINGLELIQEVRSLSPETRTILMTAYGNDEVKAEARRLETSRYITKPFNLKDLTEAVRGALGGGGTAQSGVVILSDQVFERAVARLEDLRLDVGARCIFLADMQGQRLVEAGDTRGFQASTLLALLAGGFATSSELARRFGDGESVNLNFHEGSQYEIYSANVGDSLFVAIAYDRRVQSSRVGIVWHYTRGAIDDLLGVLSHAGAEAEGEAGFLDADFGSTLSRELDSLFAQEAEGAAEAAGPTMEAEGALGAAAPADTAAPPKGTPPAEMGGREEGQPLFTFEEALARGLIDGDLLDAGPEPEVEDE